MEGKKSVNIKEPGLGSITHSLFIHQIFIELLLRVSAMMYHKDITANSTVSLLSWSLQWRKGRGAGVEGPNAYKFRKHCVMMEIKWLAEPWITG